MKGFPAAFKNRISGKSKNWGDFWLKKLPVVGGNFCLCEKTNQERGYLQAL